uniref:Uncharacterized LOC103188115 n=1 Tax=Callorhinchus milii TaxID=7868 RepID=A0A4W3HBV7_CALMI
MELKNIQWSKSEYSLNEFRRKFETSLAIAECKNGKVLSLPVNSSMLFYAMDQKTNKEVGPLTMEQVLLYFTLPVNIRSAANLTYTDMRMNPRLKNQKLGNLYVTQTYQQEILLGHTINSSGCLLVRIPIVIPMYMHQIKVVVAEGFMDDNKTQWNICCTNYDSMVNNVGFLDHFIYQDITLFDKTEKSRHGNEYAELEPLYISLQECKEDNTYHTLHSYQRQNKMLPVQLPVEYPTQVNQQNKIQESPKLKPKGTSPLPVLAKTTMDTQSLSNTPSSTSNVQIGKTNKIATMSDVPLDLQTLGVDEICDCLNLLNMNQYIKAFQLQQIDGTLLFDMDRDMMQTTLKMSNFHITKLTRFMKGWRPK